MYESLPNLFRLYKIQLDIAQREIYRAQEVVKVLDKQRQDAEHAAAKARSKVRQFRDEQLIQMARDEGRRLGIIEGMRRAGMMAEPFVPQEFARDIDGSSDDEGSDESDESDETIPSRGPSRGPMPPAHPPSRPPSRPQSHTADAAHPAGPSRPTSRAVSSRAPSTGYHSSPPPIPIPPRLRSSSVHSTEHTFRPIPDIHPIISHAPAPSFTHGPVEILPDNYVPSTGPGEFIRLPPPHELTHPPPTPERPPQPVLQSSHPPRHSTRSPTTSVDSDASRSSSRSYSRQTATPVRQHDRRASQGHVPLSAIPEVESNTASPVWGSEKPHVTCLPGCICNCSYFLGLWCSACLQAAGEQAIHWLQPGHPSLCRHYDRATCERLCSLACYFLMMSRHGQPPSLAVPHELHQKPRRRLIRS